MSFQRLGQRTRADAGRRRLERGRDHAGDRQLGAGLRRGGGRADVDPVDGQLDIGRERVPGAVEPDLCGDAAAVEAQLREIGGENAVLDQQAQGDTPDLVAHGLEAADGDLDVGVGALETAEVDRLVRQAGQDLFRRGRRCRLCRRFGRLFRRLRWRQVAVDVQQAALDLERDQLDLAGAVEAAGRGGLEAVAGDLGLFQRRLGAVAGEARGHRQRARVRLSLGQRIAEPGEQLADRADVEIEAAVEAGHRLLQHLAGITRHEPVGGDLRLEVEGLAAQDLAERRHHDRDRDGLVVEDRVDVECR